MERFMLNKIYAWLWSLQRDNCEFCKGRKGGVKGNENMFGDIIVCDYCTALVLTIIRGERSKC